MMSNLIKLFILFISACVLNIQQAVAVETVYHQCETEIARSQPDNVQLSSFTNLDVLFKLQKPFIKNQLTSGVIKNLFIEVSAENDLAGLIHYENSQKIALVQQQFTYAVINGYRISYYKYPQFYSEETNVNTNV
ncbi:MAG: hypothetical protein HRT37_04355 [Alteromonadaceae bacterium]|nr:hypothetical protein [Alteromonadaceae bacterium]